MDIGIHFITIAAVLASGLAVDKVGRATHLPRITLLVIFGVIVGPSGLGFLPDDINAWREVISILALTMIAFLLGEEFSIKGLKAYGPCILKVSFSVVMASLFCIAGGLILLGVPAALAFLMAGVGLATDPAATRDVIVESHADGPVTKTVLGVVAVDDAWAVIIFSIILGFVAVTDSGHNGGLLAGFYDVLKAAAVGIGVGIPAAFLSGRLRDGEPTLLEAISIVMLCAGVALVLDVSFLLSGMVAGATVVNLARHHDYSFHEIEHISAPFLILFFVLAGAAIDLVSIFDAGLIGIAFIVLRLAGRFAGGWVGGIFGGMTAQQSKWIGLALTPQAGVALGMALAAGHAAPDMAEDLMTLTVATVVFFEITGPVLTRYVFNHLGEAQADSDPPNKPGR
ncbi:cation:proton antiporter [Thalassospiraceae bacterium LMO-JJ14]|nr:cation:proton antiporter [Thalassospiraceae bacterium LMO-JJ14]